MAISLSNEQLDLFQQTINANPKGARDMIRIWGEAGINVDGLEVPWSLGGEVGSLIGGGIEGASYGLVDPEWGDTAYRMPEEIPIVGGESPTGLLGNVVGGALTGGLLFRQGAKHLGKPAMQKVVEKMGYSGTSKALGRGAFYAGSAAPEAVVASTFETLRSGNIEDFGSNLAMWQGVGMLATPAGRKLSKMWFKRNKAKAAGNPEVQAAVEKEIIDTSSAAEAEATDQARDLTIQIAEESPDPTETIKDLILDPEQELRDLKQYINYYQARLQNKRITHEERRVNQRRLFDLQKQEDQILAALGRPLRPDHMRHRSSPVTPSEPAMGEDVYSSMPDPVDPLRTKDLTRVIRGRVFQPNFRDTVPLEAYEEDIIRSASRERPAAKPTPEAEPAPPPVESETVQRRIDKTDHTPEEAEEDFLLAERKISSLRDHGEVGPDPDLQDPRDPKTFGRMQEEYERDAFQVEDKYDEPDVVEDSGWVEGVDDIEPDPVPGFDIGKTTVSNLQGTRAVKAAEKRGEGIDVLRKKGNNHYGNPFVLGISAAKATPKQVNEVVEKYRAWLQGDTRYANVKPQQREWILQQIDAGALDGKTLLYYTDEHAKRGIASHADALAEIVNARKMGRSESNVEDVRMARGETAEDLVAKQKELVDKVEPQEVKNLRREYEIDEERAVERKLDEKLSDETTIMQLTQYRNRHVREAPSKQKPFVVASQGQDFLSIRSDAIDKKWNDKNLNPYAKGPKLTRNSFDGVKENYKRFLMQRAIEMRIMPKKRFEKLKEMDPPAGSTASIYDNVIEIERKFWIGKTYEDYITQRSLDNYEKSGIAKSFDPKGKGPYTGELEDLNVARAIEGDEPLTWKVYYKDPNATNPDEVQDVLWRGWDAKEAEESFLRNWVRKQNVERSVGPPKILRELTELSDRDFFQDTKGGRSFRKKVNIDPELAEKLSNQRDRMRTKDRLGEIPSDENHFFTDPRAFQTAIKGIDDFRKRYLGRLGKITTTGKVSEIGTKDKKEQLRLTLARINNAISLAELQATMVPEDLQSFSGKMWGEVRSALNSKHKQLLLRMPSTTSQQKSIEAQIKAKAMGNQWWNQSFQGDQVTLTPRRIIRGTEEVQQPGTTQAAGERPVEGVTSTERVSSRGQAVSGVIEAIDDQKIVINGQSYTRKTYYVSHNARIKAERGGRGGAPIEGEVSPVTEEQFNHILRLVDGINSMRIAGMDINLASIIPENLTAKQANDLITRLSEASDFGVANKVDGAMTELAIGKAEVGITEGVREGYRPPIEIHAWVDNLPLADKERSARVVYNLLDGKFGLGSPHGRMLGMGRNPITNYGTKFNMRKIEEKQAMLARWQQSYREIRELLGVPGGTIDTMRMGAQSFAGRMRGQVTPADQLRTKLYKLAKALHEDNLSEESIDFLTDPAHKQALERYRVLMNEVADAIGLSENRRIKHYLHVLYSNNGGRPRFDMVSSRLTNEEREALQTYIGIGSENAVDTNELLVDTVKNILGGSDQWRLQGKGFSAMHRRTSEETTYVERNLDLITDSYLHGAAEFWFTREVGDTNSYILGELMNIENQAIEQGRRLPNAKRHWADYLTHLYGEPTNSRKQFATAVSNSALFNNAVDHLVGFLGAGETSDFVNAMRRVRANPKDNDDAFAILDQWEELSRSRDPMTGESEFNLRDRPVDTIRTRTAMAIHTMREGLADPTRSAPIANTLYRVQVMAKLGFNWAHAMINTLQNYTNLWPLVEGKHIGDAMMDYVHFYRNPEKLIHGKSVQELLEGSGVLDDASRYTEFTELRPGMFMENVQRVVMKPSSETEKLNRGIAYLAGYRKFRTEGTNHDLAHTKALDLVQDVHHPFNRAGTPPIMRGPMMRLFMMFKSYPIHQIEFTGGLMVDLKDNIADKGFRQALKDGDHTALSKHAFAYATLYGSALTVFAGSNFYERIKHPAHEQMSEWRENAPRYGPMSGMPKLLGGPFVDTMNDFGMAMANLAALQSEEAIEAAKNGVSNFVIPAFVRRVAAGETSPQTLLGFDEYRRTSQKPRSIRRSGMAKKYGGGF